jgi:hypothetical protein
MKKPMLENPLNIDIEPWKPHPNPHDLSFEETRPNQILRQMLYQLSLLSEIVNDAVHQFYAPRERLTSRLVITLHGRFKRWYKELPSCLQINKSKTPIGPVVEFQ